jgi:hypothetical protein
MTTSGCKATVRAVGDFPSINVRSGPGRHTDVIGELPVDSGDLDILDVRPDELGTASSNKIYQWFNLKLPDGTTGWVRDDLLDIVGDCGPQGYGFVERPTPAATLTRIQRKPPSDDIERVRKAAFNITASFEGAGYASYQSYDAGIISYGRFQFTLAAGMLPLVVAQYAKNRPDGTTAKTLRNYYQERLDARDRDLRDDPKLRALLVKAAADVEMQKAQDSVATELFWERTQTMTVQPRCIETALGQAFLFDVGIQHGIYHNMTGLAERALGVEFKSCVGRNGTTEQALILQVARIRRERLYALANYGLPGLRRRADFWLELIDKGDWDLQGDHNGEVETYEGVHVRVKRP